MARWGQTPGAQPAQRIPRPTASAQKQAGPSSSPQARSRARGPTARSSAAPTCMDRTKLARLRATRGQPALRTTRLDLRRAGKGGHQRFIGWRRARRQAVRKPGRPVRFNQPARPRTLPRKGSADVAAAARPGIGERRRMSGLIRRKTSHTIAAEISRTQCPAERQLTASDQDVTVGTVSHMGAT